MVQATRSRAEVVEWLLEGDPAIRWQVMRDLNHEDDASWGAEQARVASDGWGARLLSHRDSTGRWTPQLYGRKWISTTYSMVLLRRLGMPRADWRAVESARLLLDGRIATTPRSDTCVVAMVMAVAYWFDVDHPKREAMVDDLLSRQLDDGGWNCDRSSGHGSFHTTISALEALRECAEAGSSDPAVLAAEAEGREFLLSHRLYRSHITGEIVDRRYLRFSFPPRWHYDVLRGLDYFRAAGAMADPRLEEAIAVVGDRKQPDGTWPLQQRWPGETWFEMEEVGKPSRWNTLRAMRVLEAWQAVR